jgi:hypothetical protein
MSVEVGNLQPVRNGFGVFDGFQIVGIQYRAENGELAWWVDVWRTKMGNPVRMYWVDRGEFFNVGVHVGYNYTNNTLIQTFEKVSVDEEEKRAILEALKKWESE